MNKGIFILIIAMVLSIVFISGCTSVDNTTVNHTAPAPAYQTHKLVCPNPDCLLHDPNTSTNDYSGHIRPIDCEPVSHGNRGTTTGFHYVCQVCGEEWETGV